MAVNNGLAPDVMLKKRWVQLQCQGKTTDTIAEMTQSDIRWVRSFLTRNNLKALERMAQTRAAERAKQVLRLERMIEEASDAWERSKRDEETLEMTEEPASGQPALVTVQPTPGGTPGAFTQVPATMVTGRIKRTSKGKNGDISYLNAVQGYMRDIRGILKIDDGTKRIDMSLNIPGHDTITASLTIQEQAARELENWRQTQKERLQQMLEMEPPPIVMDDTPDPPINGQS